MDEHGGIPVMLNTQIAQVRSAKEASVAAFYTPQASSEGAV
jgi:hypothetical protein